MRWDTICPLAGESFDENRNNADLYIRKNICNRSIEPPFTYTFKCKTFCHFKFGNSAQFFKMWLVFGFISCLTVPAILGQGMIRNAPDDKDRFHSLLIDSLHIETGDMVLFKSIHLASRLTQFGTFSPFSHCGMIMRDDEDNLWITHATDNEYEGYQLQVKNEKTPRGGVIMTRLEDSFFQNGYYPRIFIYKLDDKAYKRPTYEEVYALYQRYKEYKFEISPIRFILASFDLDVFDVDLLSLPDHPKIFCSEYQIYLLTDLGLLTDPLEAPNEYTPKDISNLVFYRGCNPVVFNYKK